VHFRALKSARKLAERAELDQEFHFQNTFGHTVSKSGVAPYKVM
jgi:hypothetical protein